MSKPRLKGDKSIIDKEIPICERLDDFNKLWNMIYDEVVAMWDGVEERCTGNESDETGAVLV